MDEKIKYLLSESAELARERNIHAALKRLSEVARKVVGADICSIFLHDANTRDLWTAIFHGDDGSPAPLPNKSGV